VRKTTVTSFDFIIFLSPSLSRWFDAHEVLATIVGSRLGDHCDRILGFYDTKNYRHY
jgi:hypothetical protein